MRATLAALTLLVSMSACAVQPIPAGGPGRGERPLRAYIAPIESGGLNFYVSRPAHVALFEIVPGRGTSLVYPGPGLGRMDGLVFQGAHHLGRVRRHNRDQYLPAYTASASAGPRFFFLIASEAPLDLDRVGAFGHGLAGSMGLHFASLSAYSAMEQLATLVLPDQADDASWTSDVYIYWPQALYDSPSRRAGLIQVRCNGYTMWVPVEYIGAVHQSVCAPREDDARTPRVPKRDSTTVGEPRVIEPKRRQPLPKAQADGLRERITSSTQLDEAEARRAAPRGRSADAGRMGGGAREPMGDEPRARSRVRPDEPRSGRVPPTEGSRAREPRVASPRGSGAPQDESRGSSEPRPAPVIDRAQPSERPSRPDARPGDTPRAVPREPPCNPCQQR